MSFEGFVYFMKCEQLGAFRHLFKNILFMNRHINELSRRNRLAFATDCYFAFTMDNIKEYLRLLRSALQTAIFLTSDQCLAKVCTHLFIDDDVHDTARPTWYRTVHISIGADDGMILFYDRSGKRRNFHVIPDYMF